MNQNTGSGYLINIGDNLEEDIISIWDETGSDKNGAPSKSV